MNILAVDTAGKTAGVALLQDDRLLYEVYLDGGMTHSETLMPMIDSCLKLCGLTCADIDLYAVNAGPGSFTGLRIGLAAVKGLAFPRETLCAPVSTLEALAAAHTGEGTVLCALDARRAQVYSAAFDLATHTRLLDDDARAVTDLADFVENCKKPLFFVGDGAGLCYNKYSNVPGVLQTPPALRGGRAAAVALVAKQMAAAGQAVLPEALLSVYRAKGRFSSSTVSRVDQRILAKFISGGYFERHLNRMREIYKGKHDALLGELKPLEKRFEITGEFAGLHVLLKDRKKEPEQQLLEKAAEKKVRVYGLSGFYMERAQAKEMSTIVLGYAGLTEEEIRKGVDLLRKALE